MRSVSPPRVAVRTLAGSLLVLALAGCGASGPKLYPVSGSVLVGDQPAEGATVVFQPKGSEPGAPIPSGTVGADGKFRISTHPFGDGAPAGEYMVLVTWYPPDGRSQDNPKNRLPATFSDPQQTPFRATVEARATELEPFRVPAK